ncbi:MAG: PD-(D/E)XK nuclease family protein [Puniceicoccaceae bacterium]
MERVFTGSERPLLRSLLDFLRKEIDGAVPDLSETVLLLPTRNVGREVRAALAARAGESGRAVLSPTVATPGSLFTALTPATRAPPRAVLTLFAAGAVADTPEDIRLQAFGPAPAGTTADRLALARFFLKTRQTLAEALHDYGSLAGHLDIGDRDRWRALASIERTYRRLLGRHDLEDPDDRAARIAADPAPSFPARRLVVAGTPDFPPRVGAFLENLAASVPVSILILADPSEADRFDACGRPTPPGFGDAAIDIPAASLRICRDAGEANDSIARRLEKFPEARAGCVCGVGQTATARALVFELATRGIPAHDPGGQPFSATPAGRFFRGLVEVCFGEETTELGEWFRDPFVARWMRGRDTAEQREDWIREADEWMERIIPSTIGGFLETVGRQSPVRSSIFAATASLREAARRGGNFFGLLEDPVFEPLLATIRHENGVAEFADALLGMREWIETLGAGGGDPSVIRWIVGEAMDFHIYPERPAEAVEVLGWLELLWDERPWLQIPDGFDGAIPGTPETHPLLPETLRQALVLPGRPQRDARDAYVLQALFRLRRSGGRIDIHVPQRDLAGNVVSPSRLLYFTSEKDLPARVKLLSADPPYAFGGGPDGRPLIIHPDRADPVGRWLAGLTRISVTEFASWIRCPFTFFLERILGMEKVESETLEMDTPAFGTGIHAVLQKLDEDEETVDWGDTEALRRVADEILDDWFARRFGPRPGLVLQLQKEGLRRRIAAGARLRAEARADGWRPKYIEWNFREEGLLSVAGIPLAGKIDLVEERGAELRIIDYKTSNQVTPPREAHWTNLRGRRSFTPPALLPVAGAPGHGWKNLQLPLYAAALRRKHPGRPIRAAYGHLPAATSEAQTEEWPLFDDAFGEDALATAGKILGWWKQAGFWPPSPAFRSSDAYVWSGPAGTKAWDPGDLLDLSRKSDSG